MHDNYDVDFVPSLDKKDYGDRIDRIQNHLKGFYAQASLLHYVMKNQPEGSFIDRSITKFFLIYPVLCIMQSLQRLFFPTSSQVMKERTLARLLPI